GTWQFMSCLLLGRQHVVHTIQDDMESFVHVMLYYGLRYLKHNYARNVPVLLKKIFDDQETDNDGLVVGGTLKRSLINDFGIPLGPDFEFSSAPLQKWFKWAVQAANQWIEHCSPTPLSKNRAIQGAQGVEPQLQFSDHSSMAQAFVECLNSQVWSTDEPCPIDAAPEFDGGTTGTSKCPFASKDIDDGSTGGSTKQSRTSNAIGSRGGSRS
ncbi:hypothetical protein C0992_010931, partial [Termitomyces sp. T32_za158]